MEPGQPGEVGLHALRGSSVSLEEELAHEHVYLRGESPDDVKG